MKKTFLFLTILLALSLVFGFSAAEKPGKLEKGNLEKLSIRQAFMERSPGMFDVNAYVKEQQETYDWLMAEAAPLSTDSIITIPVSGKDLDSIEDYQCENCGGIRSATYKVRIGVVKPVGVHVGFNPLTAGSLTRTPDGGFVWTLALESPEATALRVHFSDFSLPENARLYIYNVNGEAFGPYTGNSGDFWSHTVSGTIAYVQLRQFGPISASELQSTRFSISDIGFLGKKFLLPFMQQLREHSEHISQTESLCSYNEPCVEDATCYSGSAIDNAKLAVAHMQWIEMPWIYYCTGGLVADTVGTSQIPYFLTANHCVSTDSTANTIEFYWRYWTTSCEGACYDPVGAVPRTVGADVLSTNSTGDYTLMQLLENPPAGSVFMGWTSDSVAFSDGTELFRISHPSGAPQAYSRHEVDTSAVTCGGWPRGSWIYSRDVIGATEGGSSGSPVYNLSGQIVGQLSGACGYNPNDPCDNVLNATVDGAFASYFSAVQPWLAPSTSGISLTANGYKLRGVKYVDLSWTGAAGTNVDIYRNGELIATTANDGSFTDDLGKKATGTFTYQVCETGGSTCSNQASVTF